MLFLEAMKTDALEEGKIIALCDQTSKMVNLYFKNVDGETHMFLYDNDDIGPLAVSTDELNNVECEILDFEPEWSDEDRAACNLLIDRSEDKLFEIGNAVSLLKVGMRISRNTWDEGVFIYYIPSGRYPSRIDAIKGIYENDSVPYNEYIAIKNSNNRVSPWNPTTDDILAEDYYVITEV